MNEPSRNIKKLLSEVEKEKLRFTEEDREQVFRMIEDSGQQVQKVHPIKIFIPAAAAIMVLGLLLQTPKTQQVIAAIPFFNSLFSQFGDEGKKKAVEKAEVQPPKDSQVLNSLLYQYGDKGQKRAVEKTEVQQINQTVEDNGVRVAIHEILYDGARISVSYSIEATSGEYKGENLDPFVFDMKVDGKRPPGYGFSGGSKDKKVGNRYVKVQNIDLNKALPDKFTLDLTIQELLRTEHDRLRRIKGNWAFTLPIEKTGETFEFKPTVSKKTELAELKIPKILFAPSGTVVEIDCEQSPVSDKKFPTISFDIFDSNNKKMKVLSGGGQCYPPNKVIGKTTIKVFLEPKKEIPESITIQPYYDGRSEDFKTNKINITEKLPIFLPQGENGGILINKIEKKQGEVWVYFDVTGGYVEHRKKIFKLHKGTESTGISEIEKEGDLENSESKNQIVKFKTPYSEDLTFVSPTFYVTKPIKELELKIPINKKELVKQESN